MIDCCYKAFVAISLVAVSSFLGGCGSNLEGTGTKTKSLEIVGGLLPSEQGQSVSGFRVEDTQSASTVALTDDKGRFDINLQVTGTFAALRFISPEGVESEVSLPEIPEAVSMAAALFNVKDQGKVELGSIDFDSSIPDRSASSSDPALASDSSGQSASPSEDDSQYPHNGGAFSAPPTPLPPPTTAGALGSEHIDSAVNVNSGTNAASQAASPSGNFNGFMTDTSGTRDTTVGAGQVGVGTGTGSGAGSGASDGTDNGASGSTGGRGGAGSGAGQTASNMHSVGAI